MAIRFTSSDLGPVRHRFLNLCEDVVRAVQGMDEVKCLLSSLGAVDQGGNTFQMVVKKRMWGSLRRKVGILVDRAHLSDVVWVGPVDEV